MQSGGGRLSKVVHFASLGFPDTTQLGFHLILASQSPTQFPSVIMECGDGERNCLTGRSSYLTPLTLCVVYVGFRDLGVSVTNNQGSPIIQHAPPRDKVSPYPNESLHSVGPSARNRRYPGQV